MPWAPRNRPGPRHSARGLCVLPCAIWNDAAACR